MAIDKAYTLTTGGRTFALDCPKESWADGTTAATIQPNVYNSFGTVTTLTITKGTDIENVVNIYIIRFTAGAGCAVVLDGWSCRWAGGNEPTYTEGNVYEISIIDNLAMYVEGSVQTL